MTNLGKSGPRLTIAKEVWYLSAGCL